MLGFSAVAYYYFQKMYRETGVPIGITNSGWGGTDIRACMSENGIVHISEYKILLDIFLKRRNTAIAVDNVIALNYRIADADNNTLSTAGNGYEQQ